MAYKCCAKIIDSNDKKDGGAISYVNSFGSYGVIDRDIRSATIDECNLWYNRIASHELYYQAEGEDQP